MRAIVGIEITITTLVGKWKLSQNRNAADRAGVAAGLAAEGTEDAQAVADMMAGAVSGQADRTGR